jgi:hypothetical protein
MDVLNDGETWRIDSADCLIRQYARKIKDSDNATVKGLAKTLADKSTHRDYKYWWNKIHNRGMVDEVESIFNGEKVA